MQNLLTIAMMICLTVGLGFAQGKSKLADVKKIYISNLGEGSEVIQEKIKLRLTKSSRYQLADNSEDADAMLVGAVAIEGRQVLFSGHGNTVYTATGVVRLVSKDSKETLWSYEYKPGRLRDHDAATDFANKVVERLLKDAKKAEKP
jgi:hypothetical protein